MNEADGMQVFILTLIALFLILDIASEPPDMDE